MIIIIHLVLALKLDLSLVYSNLLEDMDRLSDTLGFDHIQIHSEKDNKMIFGHIVKLLEILVLEENMLIGVVNFLVL